MFRPLIVAIFRKLSFEGQSRWMKYLGSYPVQNKSTNLYMFLLVISHTKLSVHGHESFKIYT